MIVLLGIIKSFGETRKNKLVKAVFRLNQKFGVYHTMEMLSDMEQVKNKNV